MKKLLSAVLAAAMCCVMAVPAFAADTVIVPDEDGNPNPETGDIKVSYSVSPAYTVTIPGEVTLGQTATISAQNVRVAKGSQVEVALTGINNGDSQFILTTTEGASINYTVQNASQQDVALNATVLAVDPPKSPTAAAPPCPLSPPAIRLSPTPAPMKAMSPSPSASGMRTPPLPAAIRASLGLPIPAK